MFRPITMSMEERIELIKKSFSKEMLLEYGAKCDSLESFHTFVTQMRNRIEAQMQIYVLENYEKVPVEVWNQSTFKMVPHTGKETMFFGKKDEFRANWTNNVPKLQEWAKKRYDKSIKIESIKFVLDYHDGDFSVTFNDGPWTFLWGDDVVQYYMIIKNHLNEDNS